MVGKREAGVGGGTVTNLWFGRAIAIAVVVAAAGLIAYFVHTRYALAERHAKLSPQVVDGGAGGLPDVFASLERDGFIVNRSLTGQYQPGTVLQIRDLGPDSRIESLSPPVVFLWGDKCFSGEVPHKSAYVLEESSGTSSTELQVGADLLVHWLPQMALASSAIASYSLKLKPSHLAYAKGDLSVHFSHDCVKAYAAALKKDSPNWFVVVVEAVVSEGIEYEIRWNESSSGVIRTSAIDQAKDKLEATIKAGVATTGPHVQVVDSDVNTTRLSSTGDLVLGYRTRPLEPVNESENANANP